MFAIAGILSEFCFMEIESSKSKGGVGLFQGGILFLIRVIAVGDLAAPGEVDQGESSIAGDADDAFERGVGILTRKEVVNGFRRGSRIIEDCRTLLFWALPSSCKQHFPISSFFCYRMMPGKVWMQRAMSNRKYLGVEVPKS